MSKEADLRIVDVVDSAGLVSLMDFFSEKFTRSTSVLLLHQRETILSEKQLHKRTNISRCVCSDFVSFLFYYDEEFSA